MSLVLTLRARNFIVLCACALHAAACGYGATPRAPSDIQDPRDPYASHGARAAASSLSASSATPVAPSQPAGPVATIFSGRTLGIAAGLLGLAGAGVGTVYKVRAKGLADDAKDFCDTALNRCDSRGITLLEDSRNANRLGNAAFVVWGAGIGTGALLYYYSSSEPRHTSGALPHVGLGLSSIEVRGVW